MLVDIVFLFWFSIDTEQRKSHKIQISSNKEKNDKEGGGLI